MSIDELRNKRAQLKAASDNTLDNMQIIADESLRVAEVAHNSREILSDLDADFESQTGLDGLDTKILFLATALQIGRWVIINAFDREMTKKLNESRLKDNDTSIKQMEKEKRNDYKNKHDGTWEHNKSDKYPSWLEIVFDGVPYDVTVGSPNFGVNMEGGFHRVHTLGHDPVLGWLFGTMNILSSTITLDDFRTYKISRKPKHWEYQITLFEGFCMAIESIQEDIHRLPAAIFAEALHLKSDINTNTGLPIPVLESFEPEMASNLYKEHYDTLSMLKDITKVGSQAVIAILINMIISLIHGLYYDPSKYKDREIYEVKTRKILMYSDYIASASNVIWVGGNAILGNESAIKDLDIGGMIVTMHRLLNDTDFILAVKEEFVLGEFRNKIKGDELILKEV